MTGRVSKAVAAAGIVPAGPAFVLVRPQLGENIGAAARVMWNFGLSRLRLVDPRDGWPNPAAVAMASGAGRLLDHAGPYPDTAAALADCAVVYATTGRKRGLSQPVLSPAEAMAQARGHIAAGRQVGMVFGPERAGLETADIARATAIVAVPVNPDFPSLNLAQCVAVMAYEWGRGAPDLALTAAPEAEAVLATGDERDRLGDRFDAVLGAAGYFFPPDKAPGMRQVLRAMLARLALTRGDVQLLHGALRQLARAGGLPDGGRLGDRQKRDGGGA